MGRSESHTKVDCRCSNCETSLVEIGNSWWKVTNSHVTYLPPDDANNGVGPGPFGLKVDNVPNIKIGALDFDGKNELKLCTLRILECKKCERTLGVKCTQAPDSKAQYRGKGFFKASRIHLNSTETGERVPVNIVSETPSSNGAPPQLSWSSIPGLGNRLSTSGLGDSIVFQSTGPKREVQNSQTPAQDQATRINSEPSTQQIQSSFPNETNGATQQSMPTSLTLQGDNAHSQSNGDASLRKLLLTQTATLERIMQAVEGLQEDMAQVKQWVAPRPVGRPRKYPLSVDDSPKAAATPNHISKRQNHEVALRASVDPRETTRPPSSRNETVKSTTGSFEGVRCMRCGNAPPIPGYRHCGECIDNLAAARKLVPPEKRTLSQDSNFESTQPPPKQPRKDEPLPRSQTGPLHPADRVISTSAAPAAQANMLYSKISGNGLGPQAQDKPTIGANLTYHPPLQASIGNGATIYRSIPDTERSSGSALVHLQESGNLRHSALNGVIKPQLALAPTFTATNESARTDAGTSDTQEYLKKVVVDDPDDMDYAPSNHSPSPSLAISTHAGGNTDIVDLEPLAMPATSLEASGGSKSPKSRDKGRFGANRSYNNIIFDGRSTPEWERGDSDLDEFASRIKDPVYQSNTALRGGIARRGVSRGGKLKHFSPLSKANPIEKNRDSDGYLLMANGQRDGRSMRRKTQNGADAGPATIKQEQPGPNMGDTIEILDNGNGNNSKAHNDIMSKVFGREYEFKGVTRKY